jgi:hypothetical protein
MFLLPFAIMEQLSQTNPTSRTDLRLRMRSRDLRNVKVDCACELGFSASLALHGRTTLATSDTLYPIEEACVGGDRRR